MSQQHVEIVVPLTHDGGSRPCRGQAMLATVSWLEELASTDRLLQCTSCKRMVGLDEVTGEESYLPTYRQKE